MVKQAQEYEQTSVKQLLSVLDNLEYIQEHEKITQYPEMDNQ